jgi:hypothetical protein
LLPGIPWINDEEESLRLQSEGEKGAARRIFFSSSGKA